MKKKKNKLNSHPTSARCSSSRKRHIGCHGRRALPIRPESHPSQFFFCFFCFFSSFFFIFLGSLRPPLCAASLQWRVAAVALANKADKLN